ncbi:MAG: YraN family protein [Acidobacteriota bacterium]|nr:YraN family protein [Acidobacteriota bacterium]
MEAQRRVLHAVVRVAERRGGAAHLAVGERGEREALFFLRQQGFTVVARRWRTARLRGDLDLVAWEGDCLCFVEVKTRSTRNLLDPAESAVDEEKRQRLRRMARAYLRGLPEQVRTRVQVRFDVISVYLEPQGAACELFRQAFARE